MRLYGHIMGSADRRYLGHVTTDPGQTRLYDKDRPIVAIDVTVGAEPWPVVTTIERTREDETGPGAVLWGFWDYGRDVLSRTPALSMIYHSPKLVDICFAGGLGRAIEMGRGVCVRLTVERQSSL